MKKCTKCQREKELALFYRSKNGRDGRHSWCIECMRNLSAERHQRGITKAKSTQIVIDYLAKHNIVAVPGSCFDNNYVDLMAWGVVPIEAKLSTPQVGTEKFIWTFTSGQIQKLCGFIILIADYGGKHRVFIVPTTHPIIIEKQGYHTDSSASVCVTIDSTHPLSNWSEISKYEDDYEAIKTAFMQMTRLGK